MLLVFLGFLQVEFLQLFYLETSNPSFSREKFCAILVIGALHRIIGGGLNLGLVGGWRWGYPTEWLLRGMRWGMRGVMQVGVCNGAGSSKEAIWR